jgi:hypothetical protein
MICNPEERPNHRWRVALLGWARNPKSGKWDKQNQCLALWISLRVRILAQPLRFCTPRSTLAAIFLISAIAQPAIADSNPKHGGILEFAVTVEPGNFDCHGNISFAFLQPIAPHIPYCSNLTRPIIRKSSATSRNHGAYRPIA